MEGIKKEEYYKISSKMFVLEQIQTGKKEILA